MACLAHRAALLALVAVALASPGDISHVLAGDDECLGSTGEECSLNAMQLRGTVTTVTSIPETNEASPKEIQQNVAYLDLPADWENTNGGVNKNENGALTNDGNCEDRPEDPDCFLFRACQGRSYCIMGGYMVVPGQPVAGMESINGGNAASFDYLMAVARDQCSSPDCVLITNPVHHRTQDQLHIHFRHFSGGGAGLKARLEDALCDTHGWKPFSECGSGKAAIFSGFPGVFSSVAAAYGGGSMAHIGITVWFTTACGGLQTMVLATTHCSIEHSISAR